MFSSDLQRAVETTEIALESTQVPLLLDWRLLECDYGARNGLYRHRVHDPNRATFLNRPYPGGESWRQARSRMASLLRDLPSRWDVTRMLLISHIATSWALEHHLAGRLLAELVSEEFSWREGWEYQFDPATPSSLDRPVTPEGRTLQRGRQLCNSRFAPTPGRAMPPSGTSRERVPSVPTAAGEWFVRALVLGGLWVLEPGCDRTGDLGGFDDAGVVEGGELE